MEELHFEPIGTGQTVFIDNAVEGPVRWLDSPQDVMDFVKGDHVTETIVLSRGGTTTFLTPCLTAGVKGIMTLQGAPESHLGILSREYGIPCIMGVQFSQGVRSARGEIIPTDGVQVRLDITTAPEGRVLAEVGAPTIEDWDGPVPAAMAPEQLEQIQLLLTKFGGQVPHGSDGDEQIRADFSTRVLQLDDDSLRRPLTVPEVNELSRYGGWNTWDALAARATEGDSGLIPRQEYESVAFVQSWQRYVPFMRLITERVGVDGVIEIARTARREIGTKINPLHAWALSFAVSFGRGVAIGLGLATPDKRTEDLAEAYQFMRRLYRGIWDGDGAAMFASMRGYQLPLLDPSWLERFADERTTFTDPDQRRAFQLFSASTEMMGFLHHFDNRSGLADTGPYPTPDGGFMVVRDHFIREPIYQWADVGGEELPYAISQAMFFKPDEPLEAKMLDFGTLFTEPANYLKHLTGAAVYVRDRWDTPISQLRLLGDAELADLRARCDRATGRLYPHIAAMSKREKIMAGVKVYYSDFILPFARAAGVWDEMVNEHDFHELDPVASEAYYRLVRDGVAGELVPRLFLTGEEYPPVPEPSPLEPSYARFLAQNGPLKALCARWQNAEGDDRLLLLGEFDEIVERVEPVLRATAKHEPRFSGYLDRLVTARNRLIDGDHDYATGVRCDSIHTVWMEIHEDYLQTLGIDRELEGGY